MTLPEARLVLQRVATHVLARRRYEVSGRIGLRAAPGGIATPAFGEPPEVLRIDGDLLVREAGGSASLRRITGATLRELAERAGTDLDAPFSPGKDAPAVGDPDAPLDLEARWAVLLGDWWELGYRVLDQVLAELAPGGEPATIQLWPEHFDSATTATLPCGSKVNLGFSAGDADSEQPYLYLGPWEADRPGDPGYWNAPFGAALGYEAVHGAPDPVAACLDFLRTGISLLTGGQQA